MDEWINDLNTRDDLAVIQVLSQQQRRSVLLRSGHNHRIPE